jgi:hypothetical protein
MYIYICIFIYIYIYIYSNGRPADLMDTDYGYSMQSQPVSGFGKGGVTFEVGDKLSDASTSSCTPGNVLVIYYWAVLL